METQKYGDNGSGRDAGRATEATGTGKNGRRWARFRSSLSLGFIAKRSIPPLPSSSLALNVTSITMMTMRSILLIVSDWGEEYIVPFNILPGGVVGNGVGGKETPGRLHSFAFPSGTKKEEEKQNNI